VELCCAWFRLLDSCHSPSSTVLVARLVSSTNRRTGLPSGVLLLHSLLMVETVLATVIFDFVESGRDGVKKTGVFVSDCKL
jgi:hypothetical protein